MESREDKSLFQNHVFTFKIPRFTIFIFLLIILWFFIKIIIFLSKIGPLWAHKGPYGPIRALWAHMGPNPDRAPTRTGPQPGPGPENINSGPGPGLHNFGSLESRQLPDCYLRQGFCDFCCILRLSYMFLGFCYAKALSTGMQRTSMRAGLLVSREHFRCHSSTS